MPALDYVTMFDRVEDVMEWMHGVDAIRLTVNGVLGLVAVMMFVVFYVGISSSPE